MEEEMEIETTNTADSETILTRRCHPFGAINSQEVSLNQVQHKRSALEILMQSVGDNQQAILPSLGTYANLDNSDLIIPRTRTDCRICHQPSDTMPCSFCEHNSCELCVRQCERCCGVFCTFCSTVNYSGRHDRAYCLSCNTEVKKALQARAHAH